MNTEQINDGGPAFPCEYRHHEYADAPHLLGMSLRDWLAGQVLAGHSSREDNRTYDPATSDGSELLKQDAEYCYKMADAMIAARGKEDA